MKTIRILIADDHPVVRMGTRLALSSERYLKCIGEAQDGNEILPLCADLHPDLLLLDLRMPNLTPVELVEQLRNRCPDLRIIILSAYGDDIYVKNLIAMGVAGFVLKDEMPQNLVQAIMTVMQGNTWFSRNVVRRLTEPEIVQLDGKGEFLLTEREWDVVKLLAKGYSNRMIAEELCFSESAVRFHLHNIYDKKGFHSRGEIVVWATQQYQLG
jgi:DNA-binding NarL/FixJ family response regulator